MRQPILSKVLSDIELRNLSEATKGLYMRTCARYLDFLGGRPIGGTGEADVRALSQHLRCECGLAPKAVNACLAAVPLMCEVGLDRPMSRRQVPFMRRPKAMPKAFSRDEMAAILAAAPNVRRRAQISLGYGAGLRVSEVCRLRVRDVDSEAMRPAGAARAGRSFHTLRASFATHLLEDGTDPMTIKSPMGHPSPSSTAVCLHVADMAAGVTSPADSVAAPSWL